MELIIASGYANNYGGEAAEWGYAKQGIWFPTTTDFRATAAGSHGSGEAKSLAELIALLEKKKPGTIDGLGLVGHASQETFSLAGTVLTSQNNIHFIESGNIHPVTIKEQLSKITPLQDRFTKDASITLFACHAGAGNALMDALSSAFNRCVLGFSNEIVWCIKPDAAGRKIVTRGRTFYDATGIGARPDCAGNSFTANVWAWGPDKKSCPKP